MADMETMVNDLYADADVQRMLALACKAEPLHICFPREVNVSRFVAWLLDPNQGHGLSDRAIKSLLTRAGQSDRACSLTANERRFLSASSVQTQSFSSMIVTTEADVSNGKGKRCSVDILAMDPFARLYIAIENKFGAREGVAQTHNYSRHLGKLFPTYRGIHIFLDSNDATPQGDCWLPVGYDWLSGFLADAERMNWLSAEVKSTLSQFRSIIQDADEESSSSSPLAALVSKVAGNYGPVLGLMQTLFNTQATSLRAAQLAALVAPGEVGNDAKARVRLFQLYCRAPATWDKCIRQRQFARVNAELRAAFPDLETEPRRVVTSFTRKDWIRLLELPEENPTEYLWAAGIHVRLVDEKFRIVSWIQFANVSTALREPLLKLSATFRSTYGIGARNRDHGWHALRRSVLLTPAKVAEEAVAHMRELSQAISTLP
ncbi:PD-(D/E)XK nuclease family protein [Stenotrophomonas sp.]|uniref:PD-(D/E)XK nuclease family protein n=1 Tax=Stenotrophomonas sp. TaxID=69392 RepID=UPI002FC68461